MPVCVSTEVMRSSDRWTIENLCSSKELMERAGKAIFEQVRWKGPVGIICGKGNNAGDGFVVASLLKDHGIECEIVLLYEDSFSEDGKYFFDKCVAKGIPVVTEGDYGKYNTILDCIFGTGFLRFKPLYQLQGEDKFCTYTFSAYYVYIFAVGIYYLFNDSKTKTRALFVAAS